MSKKEEIIKDIVSKKLTGADIARKYGVTPVYISQIKKTITPDIIELLKFMNEFFKRFFDYLTKNPKIEMFIELNEEKLNIIEELVK